ncbi:MAG: hypothetical protein CVV05_19475 [Gammaproteobacteria bacterium HGW-Gammaproteobacteria-1]|nr:MAG: hypothetical protein CVV05_19475 [Gammaproteobacteria bacterium HGW-Gammaproteobacteria-1]
MSLSRSGAQGTLRVDNSLKLDDAFEAARMVPSRATARDASLLAHRALTPLHYPWDEGRQRRS